MEVVYLSQNNRYYLWLTYGNHSLEEDLDKKKYNFQLGSDKIKITGRRIVRIFEKIFVYFKKRSGFDCDMMFKFDKKKVSHATTDKF